MTLGYQHTVFSVVWLGTFILIPESTYMPELSQSATCGWHPVKLLRRQSDSRNDMAAIVTRSDCRTPELNCVAK